MSCLLNTDNGCNSALCFGVCGYVERLVKQQWTCYLYLRCWVRLSLAFFSGRQTGQSCRVQFFQWEMICLDDAQWATTGIQTERQRDQGGLESWCSQSVLLHHHSTLGMGNIIFIPVIINETIETTIFLIVFILSLLCLLTNMVAFHLYPQPQQQSLQHLSHTVCMLHWTLKVNCNGLNCLVDMTSSGYKEPTKRI